MDAIQMLIRFSNSYPAIWGMLTGVCYIIGFCLSLKAVYSLKIYGDMRTMTSTQTSIMGPLTMFIVAAVLIFIPSAFHVLNYTVFGYNSPLSYTQAQTTINPVVIKALVGIVQIVGLIAFIRGWLILSAHAQHPGGQATLGKALTHIIGGLLAVNILGVVDVIWNTFVG